MGTDAILTSKKKKLWCNVDRQYHMDIDGKCTYDEWYKGVSHKRAIEILQGILKRAVGDNEYIIKIGMLEREIPWKGNVMKAIKFVKQLDNDDIIKLVDDTGDEHLRIVYQQGIIDGIFDPEEEDEGDKIEYKPYREWREWISGKVAVANRKKLRSVIRKKK